MNIKRPAIPFLTNHHVNNLNSLVFSTIKPANLYPHVKVSLKLAPRDVSINTNNPTSSVPFIVADNIGFHVSPLLATKGKNRKAITAAPRKART